MSLFNVGPEELGLLSGLIGVGISSKLSDEQQNVVGNFLVAIGSVILTVSAQQEAIESRCSSDDQKEMQHRIQNLEKQLAMIEQKLR